MNIFFYANINFDDRTIGITNKVFSQIKAWQNLGYTVYYTGYTKEGIEIRQNENIVYSKSFSKFEKKFNKFLRRKCLLNCSLKFIKENNRKFKICYLRFHYFDKLYVKLLKEMKKKGAYVVVEAHGYPYTNFSLNNYLMFPTYLLDFLYRKSASKNIDLVAAISNVKDIWGVETVFIDNCIDVSNCGIKKEVKISNAPILISASNERSYHGYAKVLKGLKTYREKKGSKEYNILFIGNYTKKTKTKVKEYGLSDSVTFLGSKSGVELKELYESSDLGIGSFGLHGGSDHGSSIKSKEYFAYGIPFINGWKEYAFDDTYPYVLRFNITEDEVDFFKVDDFIDKLNANPNDYRYEMREFAEKEFNWESKFKRILEKEETNCQ